MRVLMLLYAERKAVFLKPFPQGYEVHHSRGRVGTLLLDTRFWIATTPAVHQMIHDDPKWARDNGLLCQVGQWNSPPDDDWTRQIRCVIAEALNAKYRFRHKRDAVNAFAATFEALAHAK